MSQRSWLQSSAAVGLVTASFLMLGCAIAGDPSVADWDLSYRSVLKKNDVDSNEWLQTWLTTEKARPPIKSTLRNLGRTPVHSAVLLEYPAFHAGERLSWFFVRTGDGAFCWNFVQGEPGEHSKTTLDAQEVDRLVESLLAWDQAPPLPKGGDSAGMPGGYFAFLSVHDDRLARQLLLTLHDFKMPLDPEWKDARQGRVYEVFGPVVRLYD